MAKEDFIHINWDGLKELDALLDGIDASAEGIVMEEYNKYGLLVEAGAKALVQVDEGDLEASIHAERAKRTSDSIVVEIGSNMAYAARRHEEPYRMGVHDKYDNGAKFPDYYVAGRGRRTHAKSSWRGYKPGRKYLENAVKATDQDYDETNDRILRRITGENI